MYWNGIGIGIRLTTVGLQIENDSQKTEKEGQKKGQCIVYIDSGTFWHIAVFSEICGERRGGMYIFIPVDFTGSLLLPTRGLHMFRLYSKMQDYLSTTRE
jgi:hypothetical protein